MEGVALDLGACHRRVEKPQVECGVVTYQDGAPATVRAQGVTYLAEDSLQRIALRDCRPQRMMRVDARDCQRPGIEPCALEGLHVEGVGGAAHEAPGRVDIDQHRGNLQQRIGRGVEAAALDVDGYRQVAAKASLHELRRCGARCGLRSRAAVHARTIETWGASRQAMCSPARSGTSSS